VWFQCGCFRRKRIEEKEDGVSTLKVTAINPGNEAKEKVTGKYHASAK